MERPPLERPYTPEYVQSQLQKAGLWRVLRRIAQIASLFLMGLWWRTVDRWQWTYRKGESIEDRQRRRASWWVERIAKLGPTFVKIGQALGTRPDLLPLTYVEALSTLQDQLPPFPNEVAFACFEAELGWKPETLLAQFDMEPFAAASLGQVYYAITHGGDQVAVKIQRPDLMEVISLDLALIRRLAALLERFPRLSRRQPWVSIIDEFGAKLFEELDYVHEAYLTQAFRAHIADMPGIYAPRLYPELSSRRVITTEFIRGIKVTDKERIQAAEIDIPYLLSQGVRANLRQLFEHGLFHADPHPGNLLVRPEDGALVFIDFGMMGLIEPEKKLRIIEIFVDVINQRPENLKENLIALGCLRPDARWEELVPLANQLFKSVFGGADRRYRFQDVTHSFAPLLYEYEFRIPVDFGYIIRAIMTLEGISLQLAPEFDIFSVSAPYAVRMMLTFPDPSLRQRLIDELLTADGELNWQRLEQLASLASHETTFKLDTEGLAAPALDMLLSPEGESLRRALVADLFKNSDTTQRRVQKLASLLRADPSLSGRAILDRLIAFLLSPEGAETRAQLTAGLKAHNGSGLDLLTIMDLIGLSRQLHPDFRTRTLLSALGNYLLSEEGKPWRNELAIAGTHYLFRGVRGTLGLLTRPVTSPSPQQVAAPEHDLS